MKRQILFSILFVSMLFAASAKTKLKITNTIGGDSDSLGDYDLYTSERETDIDDDVISSKTYSIGDRFRIDLENSLINARLQMEVLYHKSNSAYDEIPDFVFAPSGYIHFTPIKQFGIVAGTNYGKLFAIPSGYLAAADDTTKYARLLTDTLGYDTYLGSDTASIYYNGYGGGLTGNFVWGGDDQFYVKAAAGSMLYTDSSSFDYSVDFGLNGGIEGIFDAGFTAHNIFDDERKFGAFAGLMALQNLILNAGFYYNFTLSDYLPEARVERSGEDEFKKQKTKYAFGVTGGYDFLDIGLGLYADFITGLTNEYIGDIKYYDEDGNLIKTVTTTIIRGSTCVKYKDGVAKRTDEFTHEAIPYYAQLRLSYDATEFVNLGLSLKLRSMWNDSETSWFTIYPKVNIELPSSAGKISAGLCLDMNLTRYEGISSISVPVSYTYKFKTKF